MRQVDNIESICNIAVASFAILVQLYHIFIFFTHKIHLDNKVNNILINSERNQSLSTDKEQEGTNLTPPF